MEATPQAGLRIHLFGPTRAEIDGVQVNVGPHLQRGVLAFLALSAGHVVPLARLIDAIWGEEAPATAKNALQVYVGGLRRSLGTGAAALKTIDPGYLLDVPESAVDVLQFERLVQGADGVGPRHALDLWTADPLADLLDLPFGESVVARLGDLRMRALEERIQNDLDSGQVSSVAIEIEHLLIDAPYRERLWRQLMLARYREGRQADALETFQRARRLLDEDLGIAPGPALVALEQAILVQDPALDVLSNEPHPSMSLPSIPTPTVGRHAAIANVGELVAAHRLTTILGPGGIGKTRLAVEVAHATTSVFSDGVYFVDLSAVRDERAFIAELAQAVDARADNDDEMAIRAALADRHVLLVLDNTEQLPNAGPVIANLLAHTQGPHLLVTTRVALRIAAEHVMALPTLSSNDATALLASRVQAATGAEPSQAVVADLASRLDGLPLAIELAAASCAAVGPQAVLGLLADRLPLPSAPRDLPERQQTLTSMVEWSLDLLDEPERELLGDLTAFRAAFTLDSAVALADGDVSTPVLLATLVDSSLVLVDGERYRLVQPVRDVMAAARDAESADRLEDRHAEWIIRVTSSAAAELYDGDEEATRARLLALVPDMRAAFERLMATRRHEDAARVVLDVAQVWFHAGRLHEAEANLGRVVDQPGLSRRTHAEALALRGIFAKMTGDDERSAAWIAAGIDGLRELAPDSIALVNSLCHLADLRVNESQEAEAVALADEAVRAARRTGDEGTISMALDLAGYIARAVGDDRRAIDAARAAVEEARQHKSFLLADALAGLAASLGTVDPDAAATAWEAVALAEEADALSSATLIGALGVRAGGQLPDEAHSLDERLRETLGDGAYARARGSGGALGDDELSRLAAEIAARLAQADA